MIEPHFHSAKVQKNIYPANKMNSDLKKIWLIQKKIVSLHGEDVFQT